MPRHSRNPGLTSAEIDSLLTIERTGAGLSMVAISLIALTFIVFKKLRTTPNLFLLVASLANAGASVASMMGHDGLRKGEASSLCQAQAFIFEWFMQSDPWWSFAMAINVFLVFFNNADPCSFRRYLWVYCLVCFGGPFIPAVVLISITGDHRGPIYGDAVLWCWISDNWSLVRLYAYYIPIWLCILLSFVIYFAVGIHVFHRRNQLMSISMPEKGQQKPVRFGRSGCDSAEESLTRRQDAYGTVVTEVHITSSLPPLDFDLPTAPTYSHPRGGLPGSSSWTSGLHGESSVVRNNHHQFETICSSDTTRPKKRSCFGVVKAVLAEASLKLKRLDPVKMAYLRTSFIFGLSILITWIPSSVNRLYSLANGGRISFGLSVASGCVLPLQGVWNAIIYLTTS
ncbi:hypothetical protein XA68_10007 [Ophiocordyceps unilateralis]|uniref:G-protein coupled receptors family 2 profile 2 domain-containing protein n=1 Tax=Ophiocordyceps unilateralis TaxID=268505 RepID=A0A2A9PQJ9_OPHUN|nr:hypothetical protein XA68_10007 [Ophiocordyceps unilateralis]